MLISQGLTGLLVMLLAFLGVNTYFYLNPLDEPGVGFQVYLPNALPNNTKISTTDAKIVALVRDPRHDRKDWLGRDLDAARLEVIMQDETGKYIARITEQPGFTTSCTPKTAGYRLTPKGVAYCLGTIRQASGAFTSLDLSFNQSISVASSTRVMVSIEMPTNLATNSNTWDAYADSFQKKHLFNIPVETYTDPMQY